MLKDTKNVNLAAADVFALGLTAYEVAACTPLCSEGPEHDALRDGRVPPVIDLDDTLFDLIKAMLHPDPAKRLTAYQVQAHPALTRHACPPGAAPWTHLTFNPATVTSEVMKLRALVEKQSKQLEAQQRELAAAKRAAAARTPASL